MMFQYIIRFNHIQETVPLKGGRGTAHLLLKCKMCSRENSLGVYTHALNIHHYCTHIEILEDHIIPYKVMVILIGVCCQ